MITKMPTIDKFDQVLKRCKKYGIVLKMKKSFIGVDTVTFLVMRSLMANGNHLIPVRKP